MTKQDAIAVRFEDGRAVPVEQAFAYADSYDGLGFASPSEIIWSDGTFSFAKGWWDARRSHILCEIGAGAYGSMCILRR